jgi:hypothetical protein
MPRVHGGFVPAGLNVVAGGLNGKRMVSGVADVFVGEAMIAS